MSRFFLVLFLLTVATALFLFLRETSAVSPTVPLHVPLPATEGEEEEEEEAPTTNLTKLTVSITASSQVSFYVWNVPEVTQWVMGGSGGETKVMRTFVRVLTTTTSSSTGDVLDVGANTGIYGMLAASLGFRTYLFDLQPACQVWQRAAIRANRLGHLAHVMPYALGRSGNSSSLRVSPLTPCVGNLRPSTAEASFRKQTTAVDPGSFFDVPIRPLDEVYEGERVLLAKIDTEGFEAEVLGGMQRLLAERRVQHIVVECSPTIWVEHRMERARVAREIAALWDAGFTDVTFFLNSGEPGEDIHFRNRQHLLDTLLQRPFYQNDILFSQSEA
jgi:FkbM family methyltransferase